MAVWMLLLTFLVQRMQLVAGVQPKELSDWFSSPNGLAMNPADASVLAAKSWSHLTQCGVAIEVLQSLRDTMYNSNKVGLDIATVRAQILLLAEQHISPNKLYNLYYFLSSSYTISGGLGLPKAQAQSHSLQLVLARAEPDNLKALYQVMYGYSGLGFDRKTAQVQAIQESIAGTDSTQFKTMYLKTNNLMAATDAGVQANLQGLVRRYARDAKPYTAEEFQTYFAHSWLSEWIAGPLEKRLSNDKKAYTASQFNSHFGSKWADKYKTSMEATQIRIAPDGKSYSMLDFQKYYGNTWQNQWAIAPEVPCKQCAPYFTQALPALVV